MKDDETAVVFPNITGINVASAMLKLELEFSAYKEVLMTFYQVHKQSPNQINDLFLKEKWHGLQDFSHRIKGSAGNIGALSLESEALKLEKNCNLAILDSSLKKPCIHKIIIAGIGALALRNEPLPYEMNHFSTQFCTYNCVEKWFIS